MVSAQFLVQLRTLLEDSYTGESARWQRCLSSFSGSASSNAIMEQPGCAPSCCRLGAGLFLTLRAGLPKQQRRHHRCRVHGAPAGRGAPAARATRASASGPPTPAELVRPPTRKDAVSSSATAAHADDCWHMRSLHGPHCGS